MKTKILKQMVAALGLLAALILPCSKSWAQGTAFTYQGRLNSGGAPANGLYDFRFRLAADPLANNYVGNPYPTNGIPVTNGLFITTMDFGPGVFAGSNYWLEVDVRADGGSSYTVLSPLQALTPTPYAIFAANASNLVGVLPAAQLSGAVTNGNLPSSPTVSGTVTAGSFTGNGANVTNVNAAALNGLNATNFWKTGGNSGTTAGLNYLGTPDNQPLEIHVNGQRAFRLEPGGPSVTLGNGVPTGAPNVVGGAQVNYVAAGVVGATISGGGATNYGGSLYNTNSVSADFGTIGGGSFNTIQTNANNSTIGGGIQNTIQPDALYSTVAGGFYNHAIGVGDVIGGGGYSTDTSSDPNGNFASGYDSVIGGGVYNHASYDMAVVGGGLHNTAGNYEATVSGGERNTASGQFATVGGGLNNTIQSGADTSTIGGGNQNSIQQYSPCCVLAGGSMNLIGATATNAVIVGGMGNIISTNASDAYLGGGVNNFIGAGGTFDFIGGGELNTNLGLVCSIGYGAECFISSNIDLCLVNGAYNVVTGDSSFAVIGGGAYNVIGSTNSAFTDFSPGHGNVICGGAFNTANAGVAGSFIGGGLNNLIENNADDAVIVGGKSNIVAGSFSFAAGQQAQALNNGSFVWADSQNAPFASTATNQFLIRAGGGVGIGTTNPGAQLDVGGPNGTSIRVTGPAGGGATVAYDLATYNPGTNAPSARILATDDASYSSSLDLMTKVPGSFTSSLQSRLHITSSGNVGIGNLAPSTYLQVVNATCNGSSWVNASDRNLKQNFASVDAAGVLAKVVALPVQSWDYKAQPGEKHIGPVAQDFHAAFGLNGADDRHIATVDESGVALAAIQGLNEKLETENAELKQRLAKLESLVDQMAQERK